MTDIDVSSWGDHAPSKKTLFLRALIGAGLGRGAVRAKILESWIKNFGSIVDINVRGINYRLNLKDNVIDCKILASSVVYDKKELAILENACKGGVFVDVGANIGYYSLVLAKKASCKVVAIEPNPPTLERLYFNIAVNRSLKEKIRVIPFGVGDPGEFELHLGEDLGLASLHSGLFKETGNSVKIKTRPLLDILEEQNINRVDALKIDIEGMEDQALVPFFENAPLRMRPKCMVIENDHQDLWETDLFKILGDNGYTELSSSGSNTIFHLQKKVPAA